MKLYSILYEDAKTPEEALGKGVVALKVGRGGDNPVYILLVSKKRMLELAPVDNNPVNPDETQILNILRVDTKPILNATAIANRAVVGMIKYREAGVGLYKVSLSAGVNKFGVLAYQVAMFNSNGWMRSDTNLSPDSFGVWNKMYAKPETYERKWLGDFGRTTKKDLFDALKASDVGTDFYIQHLRNSELYYQTATSEEDFRKLLNSEGKDLSDFGNLYAYKLINPNPKVNDMFAEGAELIDEIERRGYQGIPATLSVAATSFFHRRFKD